MLQLSKLFERTFEHTERNHLKIRFSSSDYERAPGHEYIVTAGRPRRPVYSPFVEAQIAAKKIHKAAKGKPIYLCLSGGIDSEAMAEAFVAAEIPFTAAILEFEDNLNDFDINYAKSFIARHDLKSRVYKLDILDFFISDSYMKYATEHTLVSPQLCAHIWLLEQLKDGVPVLAWNPPMGCTDGSPIYRPMLPTERYFAFEHYFKKNKLPGIGFFFLYTPELIHSFFELKTVRDHLKILEENAERAPLMATYENKCMLYREGGFQALPREDKFTGFEKVKRRFYEMLGGSEDIFNERYRYPLEERFPFPSLHTSVFEI